MLQCHWLRHSHMSPPMCVLFAPNRAPRLLLGTCLVAMRAPLRVGGRRLRALPLLLRRGGRDLVAPWALLLVAPPPAPGWRGGRDVRPIHGLVLPWLEEWLLETALAQPGRMNARKRITGHPERAVAEIARLRWASGGAHRAQRRRLPPPAATRAACTLPMLDIAATPLCTTIATPAWSAAHGQRSAKDNGGALPAAIAPAHASAAVLLIGLVRGRHDPRWSILALLRRLGSGLCRDLRLREGIHTLRLGRAPSSCG